MPPGPGFRQKVTKWSKSVLSRGCQKVIKTRKVVILTILAGFVTFRTLSEHGTPRS